MGRGSENLPLARASRPSAAGGMRRVLRLADYTGGRLSFGNERAAPLVFPSADAARLRGCGDRRGFSRVQRGRHPAAIVIASIATSPRYRETATRGDAEPLAARRRCAVGEHDRAGPAGQGRRDGRRIDDGQGRIHGPEAAQRLHGGVGDNRILIGQ